MNRTSFALVLTLAVRGARTGCGVGEDDWDDFGVGAWVIAHWHQKRDRLKTISRGGSPQGPHIPVDR